MVTNMSDSAALWWGDTASIGLREYLFSGTYDDWEMDMPIGQHRLERNSGWLYVTEHCNRARKSVGGRWLAMIKTTLWKQHFKASPDWAVFRH